MMTPEQQWRHTLSRLKLYIQSRSPIYIEMKNETQYPLGCFTPIVPVYYQTIQIFYYQTTQCFYYQTTQILWRAIFVLPSVGGIDSDLFGSILLMLDLRQCSIFSLKIEHRRRSSISSIDLHISESIPPTLGRMKIARYNISQLVPESSLCTTLVPRSRMRYPSHSS